MEHPTVNVCGTSRETLIDEYMRAISKVTDAIKAVNEITVHDRDYGNAPGMPIAQCAPNQGARGVKARKEMRARIMQLMNVEHELLDIYSKLVDEDPTL